jgi:hypothetical protein
MPFITVSQSLFISKPFIELTKQILYTAKAPSVLKLCNRDPETAAMC